MKTRELFKFMEYNFYLKNKIKIIGTFLSYNQDLIILSDVSVITYETTKYYEYYLISISSIDSIEASPGDCKNYYQENIFKF